MDGGIIESALIGAAIGGGTSALTGGDPLKGMLTGLVTGGVGGAIGGPAASGLPGGTGVTATNPLTAAGAASGAETAATASSLVDAAQAAGTPIQGLAGTQAGAAAAVPQIPTGGISDLMQQPVGTATGQMGFKVPGNFAEPASLANTATAQIPTSLSGNPQIATSMSGMPQEELWNTIGAGKSDAVKAAQEAVAPKSTLSEIKDWWKGRSPTEKILYGAGGSMALQSLMNRPQLPKEEKYKGPLSKFHYDPSYYTPSLPMAEGGIATLGGANIAVGGDPRRNLSPINQDGFDQSSLQAQSSPTMNMAHGGIADLGSYSDGGRLLKGPGDGMSDNIPATIGRKQPARLAEGEFVVPADVVSHLGNGSTDAGAKKLYDMMNKVRKARTGQTKQGRQINPDKYMPESGVKAMASGGQTTDNTLFNLFTLNPFFGALASIGTPAPAPAPYVPNLSQNSNGQFYRTMDTPPPGYRVSSDAPAFYQPIYRSSYQDYNVGNPLSISQYGTSDQSSVNPGIASLLAQLGDAAQARSAAQSGK